MVQANNVKAGGCMIVWPETHLLQVLGEVFIWHGMHYHVSRGPWFKSLSLVFWYMFSYPHLFHLSKQSLSTWPKRPHEDRVWSVRNLVLLHLQCWPPNPSP